MDWADELALSVSGPQVVNDSKTPSGTVHIGSLRGPVILDTIWRALRARGLEATLLYGVDDYDPMDAQALLTPDAVDREMGRPLFQVPDPVGTCHESYARHFAGIFIETFAGLGIHPDRYYWMSDIYPTGDMDPYIRTALDKSSLVRDIYRRVAKVQHPDTWHPLSVICENCGKIGTTIVTEWDGERVRYECRERLVEWATGCGHSGWVSPFKGRAKLPWNLEWAAQWSLFGVTIEPAGKDLSTAGGSRDRSDAIAREVFEREPPLNVPYEFINIGGKKMSTSKGRGAAAHQVAEVVPAKQLRLLFVRSRPNHAINFEPFGTDAIPRLFDEYSRLGDAVAGRSVKGQLPLGYQSIFRYAQLSLDADIEREAASFRPQFMHLSLLTQIPRFDIASAMESEKGAELTAVERETLRVWQRSARAWLDTFAPERVRYVVRTDALPSAARHLDAPQRVFLASLERAVGASPPSDGESWQDLIYETARAENILPSQAFEAVYLAFLGRTNGPRAGWLLAPHPLEFVQRRLREASADVDGHPFRMTVDLAVVESLGINLYSNAAAVVSELVANSYDADATRVAISWKQDEERIIVADNGSGLSPEQINDRFLRVGYKKRAEEGVASPIWGRPFMGRKGIGKLSVFSIADEISLFTTTTDGLSTGLRIRMEDLERSIRYALPYHPEPIDVPAEHMNSSGTVIVLTELKRKRADLSVAALRKRLARRFNVIDSTPEVEGGFKITVNGAEITWDDRQELKNLQFIWEFGESKVPDSALPPDITRIPVPKNVVDPVKGWKITGWVGTAKSPQDLVQDTDAGSLKNVIVLARKRPIQEGILEKLDFDRLFTNYVTGQIEADFLDLDGEYDDIATSDRQRLIEDDDRVVALRTFLREFFVRAADQWSARRPKKQAADAWTRWPRLKEWIDGRPEWQQANAEKMIGTIANLQLESDADRLDLFRAGILAFERLGLREVTGQLERLSDLKASDLLALLGEQDAYESALWVDILRSRVEAISHFKNLAGADEKEKVLQRHLFDHLWLLDPAWERAAVGGRLEEDLRRVAPGMFARDHGGTEVRGRLDIRYATAAGRHVIVELKRYSAKEQVEVFREQGLKYFDALRSILQQQGRADEAIEVVFVLGRKPLTAGAGASSADEYIADQLRGVRGRYVLYDQLIENASRQYEDYLGASIRAKALDDLLINLGAAG